LNVTVSRNHDVDAAFAALLQRIAPNKERVIVTFCSLPLARLPG